MGTQILSGPLHYSFQKSVICQNFCCIWGRSRGILKLRNPNAQSFTHVELQNAILETIASINQFGEEAGVNEVCSSRLARLRFWTTQPLHSPA
jgi:hypothetical protein